MSWPRQSGAEEHVGTVAPGAPQGTGHCRGDRSSQLWWDHLTQKKPQTEVSRAGKYSSKNSYYKNTASSCFPWALTPNVLHLSSVVIKAQQSH